MATPPGFVEGIDEDDPELTSSDIPGQKGYDSMANKRPNEEIVAHVPICLDGGLEPKTKIPGSMEIVAAPDVEGRSKTYHLKDIHEGAPALDALADNKEMPCGEPGRPCQFKLVTTVPEVPERGTYVEYEEPKMSLEGEIMIVMNESYIRLPDGKQLPLDDPAAGLYPRVCTDEKTGALCIWAFNPDYAGQPLTIRLEYTPVKKPETSAEATETAPAG